MFSVSDFIKRLKALAFEEYIRLNAMLDDPDPVRARYALNRRIQIRDKYPEVTSLDKF